MLSDVPNLAIALGYSNASWTLKCDLICEFVCRLVNYMDEHSYAQATPRPGPVAGDAKPFLDLRSGYVMRSIDKFPKQGPDSPWRAHQNYIRDIAMFRFGELEDGMEFTAAAPAAQPADPVAA
jgi:hypothetical protein